MNGEFIGKGWKYGLNEVRPDANIGGDITPLLGTQCSRLTDYVVGKSIVRGLDFKLKGGRCDYKGILYSIVLWEIKLKGTGKARNQVILLVTHPITRPWVKWNYLKRNLS